MIAHIKTRKHLYMNMAGIALIFSNVYTNNIYLKKDLINYIGTLYYAVYYQ